MVPMLLAVINVITNKTAEHTVRNLMQKVVEPWAMEILCRLLNFFMRADSGSLGKFKMNIHGSKRDIMPIYAGLRPVVLVQMISDDDHGF